MAPTLMGWVVDPASLTPIGSLVAGTAMMIKIGACRSVLGFARLRLTVSGPKLAYAEPAWPAPPTVSCARVRAMQELPPPLTWMQASETEASEVGRSLNQCMPVRPLHVNSTVVLAKRALKRSEFRATPSPSVPRCIAFGSALLPSSSGSGSCLPS